MPDSQESVQELSKLQTFFNVATDLLCIAGTDGYFQHINPAFCNVLGYSEQHLLSEPLLSFIHPDDRASSQKEIEQAIRGKKIRGKKIRFPA